MLYWFLNNCVWVIPLSTLLGKGFYFLFYNYFSDTDKTIEDYTNLIWMRDGVGRSKQKIKRSL